MCRFVALLTVLVWLSAGAAFGAEYRLNNGDVLKGEAASFNDDGLAVRLDLGGFSPRVAWGKLTQETLKELAENPQAREFVEPYIEIPIEVRQAEKQKRKEIKVTEPSRVALPEGKTGFLASLANPVGWFLLGTLYLANLFSGYEISRFKSRPAALVVGVSVIAPILGPLIFALLPSGEAGAAGAPADAAAAPAEALNPMAQALPSTMAGSGLGLAAQGAKPGAGAASAYGQVYNRTSTTFERRFFETKFTGFFRVVPGDAEKDLLMVVKTPKSEIVGVRVTRISANEIHLQLQRGGETSVAFSEIVEVSTRAKSAK